MQDTRERLESHPQAAHRRPRRLVGRADPAARARRGGVPRRALPRPPARRRRRPGPAQPDAAGDRRATSTARTSRPAPTSRRRTRSPRRDRPGGLRVRRTSRRDERSRARGSRAEVADEFGGLVAGSVGPLNVALSLSPRVDDPAYRSATFDEVARRRTRDQIGALREGGVDLLLIETVFDSLNAKAAIVAAQDAAPELPLWLSFTAIDKSGRNLSGQTVEAFWISVEHAQPLVVGVNCSLGAAEMRPFVEDLAEIATTWVACYPNAGLPNEFGVHDEQPRGHEPLPRRVRARRARQHRRRLLRHDAGARPADRRGGRRRRAARRSRAARRDSLQRARAVRDHGRTRTS